MSPEKYVHANTEDAVERERLGLLELTVDPITIRRLEALAVGEGWNCLEVGAGGGSVARWLAQRVGPGGKVVATDINTRFLRDLTVPNIEVHQHNILTDDLEEGRYDLVHCRALLMHLSEPEKALGRMAAAERPGGWLLIEEADYSTLGAAHPKHPSAEPFNAANRTAIEELRRRGVLDPIFGRRVRDLVEGVGFIDVGHEGVVGIHRGGEPRARFQKMTTEVSARPMVAAGVITEEQYAHVQRSFEDPTFYFVGPIMFAAWGRRPN